MQKFELMGGHEMVKPIEPLSAQGYTLQELLVNGPSPDALVLFYDHSGTKRRLGQCRNDGSRLVLHRLDNTDMCVVRLMAQRSVGNGHLPVLVDLGGRLLPVIGCELQGMDFTLKLAW